MQFPDRFYHLILASAPRRYGESNFLTGFYWAYPRPIPTSTINCSKKCHNLMKDMIHYITYIINIIIINIYTKRGGIGQVGNTLYII